MITGLQIIYCVYLTAILTFQIKDFHTKHIQTPYQEKLGLAWTFINQTKHKVKIFHWSTSLYSVKNKQLKFDAATNSVMIQYTYVYVYLSLYK